MARQNSRLTAFEQTASFPWQRYTLNDRLNELISQMAIETGIVVVPDLLVTLVLWKNESSLLPVQYPPSKRLSDDGGQKLGYGKVDLSDEALPFPSNQRIEMACEADSSEFTFYRRQQYRKMSPLRETRASRMRNGRNPFGRPKDRAVEKPKSRKA